MRVAVHLPESHPAGPGVVAFRLGRIREGIDNHVLHTGVTTPLDEFVVGLLAQAKAEFPEEGVEVKLERLVSLDDGTAEWVAVDQVTDEHVLVPPGEDKAAEFHVEVGQEAV